MRAIHTKLEDVYNSQAALNQKMGVIQMALDDAPDVELEAALAEAYGNAQRNAELIRDAAHKYEMAINARSMEEG
jgi:hypothetical protein